MSLPPFLAAYTLTGSTVELRIAVRTWVQLGGLVILVIGASGNATRMVLAVAIV